MGYKEGMKKNWTHEGPSEKKRKKIGHMKVKVSPRIICMQVPYHIEAESALVLAFTRG
jgi:hypothetical protein